MVAKNTSKNSLGASAWLVVNLEQRTMCSAFNFLHIMNVEHRRSLHSCTSVSLLRGCTKTIVGCVFFQAHTLVHLLSSISTVVGLGFAKMGGCLNDSLRF